ncbi:mechanosensitive ion channel family protein [Methanobrevibacter sp.]|uniref:mechanosensitive ion channel family protein n=1 Tax=Methanobrevibacter sp. TaxID=66852 RepID=UPI00388D4CFF
MYIPTTFDDATWTFISIIIIIVITLAITRFVAFSMNKMERFQDDMTAAYLIRDIITYVIYFIALMVILQFFGINVAGTLLSVGIVGIAVSFAAKDIISNLFSGIILIIGKSVKVGETIEINNQKGYVERIFLRSTVIVNDLGVRINVPNSTLTNNTYLQYKKPEKYRIDIHTGLKPNVDIEDFSKYIIEKISSYDGVAENPKPQVFAKEITFEESKVKVSFWIKEYKTKDEYKLIITNEIRKYVEKVGE